MTEEVKEEYQHWENEKKAHEILEECGVEPVMVDPLITTKLAYVENLQNEIQGLQEQMTSLQYQLDIRVTALAMYQSTLEVKEDEEQKANGEDLTK